MSCIRHLLAHLLLLLAPMAASAFHSTTTLPLPAATSSAPRQHQNHNVITLNMGWFDGMAKAFDNQDYKEQDIRVRASHILLKGENNLEKIDDIMGEILDRTQDKPELLPSVFAEVAKKTSQCSSADQGGDLGLFGKGKMVKEFDYILFPSDNRTPPEAGEMVGPVLTEFGCHVILVTQRDVNRDQVEEKLARND